MLGDDGVDDDEDGVALPVWELSDHLEVLEELPVELAGGEAVGVPEDDLVGADAEDGGDLLDDVERR